jgi:hypothetical protein
MEKIKIFTVYFTIFVFPLFLFSAPFINAASNNSFKGAGADGDRVQTTANLNVRRVPSINAELLGAQPAGSFGTIIGESVSADGFNWRRIDYDAGPDGWSAEDWLERSVSFSDFKGVNSLKNSKNSQIIDNSGEASTSQAFTAPETDAPTGASVIWTGEGGDGKWSNPLNWAFGVVPGPNSNVVIDRGSDMTWDAPEQIKSLNLKLNTFGVLNISGTKTVTHNLALLTSQGKVNGGILNVKGNIIVGGNLKGGTVTLNINGSTNQTISNFIQDGNLPGIRVDKPSGMLIIPERIKVGGDWNFVNGALAGFGNLVLTLYDTTFTPGDASYYDVTVMKNAHYNLNVSGSGNIANDLSLITPNGKISGGTLNVKGSLIVAGTFNIKDSTTVINRVSKNNLLSVNLEKFDFMGNISGIIKWLMNAF